MLNGCYTEPLVAVTGGGFVGFSWMEEHRDEKEWRGVDLGSGHVDETTRLGCTGSMAGCLLVQEVRQGPNMVRSQGPHGLGRGRHLHCFVSDI